MRMVTAGLCVAVMGGSLLLGTKPGVTSSGPHEQWVKIVFRNDLPPRTNPVVKLGFVACLPFRLRHRLGRSESPCGVSSY